MAKTILAIHKDSTKFYTAKVEQGDERVFMDQAFEQIKKDMSDPDIHPSRLSIFEIEGDFKILSAREYSFVLQPQQPVNIVTHGA